MWYYAIVRTGYGVLDVIEDPTERDMKKSGFVFKTEKQHSTPEMAMEEYRAHERAMKEKTAAWMEVKDNCSEMEEVYDVNPDDDEY